MEITLAITGNLAQRFTAIKFIPLHNSLSIFRRIISTITPIANTHIILITTTKQKTFELI